MIEVLQPESREHWLAMRAKDVTSTSVSCLFGPGVNPWISRFELWHILHDGRRVDDLDGDRIMWGECLQDGIAVGISRKHGLKLRKMTEYIRDSDRRFGASFDFSIEEPLGILEIKNVDSLVFRNEWLKDEENGALEAPLHIEIQHASQLMLSGRSYGFIAPLVGGNDLRMIRREKDEATFEAIRTKLGEFWASIEEHREPEPEFEIDGAFIAKLYQVTPNKVLNAKGDEKLLEMVTAYDVARAREKIFKAEKEAAKAAILFLAKDAERIMAPEYSVWAATVKGGHRSYDVGDYRGWKVTMKGKKK